MSSRESSHALASVACLIFEHGGGGWGAQVPQRLNSRYTQAGAWLCFTAQNKEEKE